jgi:hypothetical protein
MYASGEYAKPENLEDENSCMLHRHIPSVLTAACGRGSTEAHHNGVEDLYANVGTSNGTLRANSTIMLILHYIRCDLGYQPHDCEEIEK